MRISIIISIIVLSFCKYAGAQTVVQVVKNIAPSTQYSKIDSNSIIPGSLKIYYLSDSIKHNLYKLNWVKAQLKFDSSISYDSVIIKYRTFNFDLSKKHQLRNTQIIENETLIKYNKKLQQQNNRNKPNLSENDELSKVGSISRGVAFGNNQNLSVNSNLDLQLSGKISDDYTLLAALSDRNIPIQPEGTTSNIQEFDQVFVNLKGKGTNITLGDFFVKNQPDEYFFKTYKKSQGISAFQTFTKNNNTYKVGGNVGVTRGRFARNTFNGEEGNQGPYRLVGENGGLFIIVIAGTERIFINGKQLKRGEQNEYTIDYNTGEITFTPNQLITSLDRIVVEFQYADNSFERSLMHATAEMKNHKVNWRVNYYSEQDNKNKPFYTTFNTQDIIKLAQVGDNISEAFKESGDTANLTENTIAYLKKDTIVNGVGYSNIYIKTNNNDGAYRVTFSLVGANNGNYVQEATLINGRVYKWVAPINGVKQGNYEPIIQLIAPNKTQLLTGLLTTKLSPKMVLTANLALSKNDVNTFSSLDSENDNGMGSKLNIVRKDSIKNIGVETSFGAEFTSKNFKTLERFRSVEFTRTWNRQLSNQTSIVNGNNVFANSNGKIKLSKKQNYIQYEFGILSIGQSFNGQQQKTTFSTKIKKATISGANSIVNTNIADTLAPLSGSLVSRSASAILPIRGLELSGNFSQENNQYRFNSIDSMLKQSFGFKQYGAQLKSNDTLALRFEIGYNKRENTLPINNTLVSTSKSNDITGKIGIGKGPNFRFNLGSTYRIFDDLTGIDSLDENTLLNRAEYRLSLLKGVFQTNSYYQIGTGRERQFEVLYLYVGEGLGDFVWADLNQNEQKDLGEFRPEEYNGQGDYVRTIVNSNTYVKAISNEFLQTINITPAVIWSGKKGVKKVLSKFSNQTNGSIKRKTTDNNSIDQFNPFALDVESDFLISTSAQIRNSLYFNRLSTKFSIEYTHIELLNKNLFVYGFEGQEKKEDLLQLRWNTTKVFSLFPVYSNGQLKSVSESFENKNYTLSYQDLKLKGQIQKGTNIRYALSLEQYKGLDSELGIASVNRRQVGMEFTYSKALKGVITAKLNYIMVDFTGEKNSPLGFSMLNGLQPGTNYTWTVITNYQISKQAQIGVNYEGRYSETNKVIQTGSVNARWLF
ncbi:MAG: hypothetical protein ACPGLV_02060 [Bacteroidia bacterium]